MSKELAHEALEAFQCVCQLRLHHGGQSIQYNLSYYVTRVKVFDRDI